ncbi:MAG: hypothetical protein ACD_52C00032G0002 [uncultured bacterium]|nr:MAG: hypothetical protein ACD_52C00032G0002 [uncultured bacterium]OGM15055.1 MAG: hypothetical protein A2W15_04480 [Candidatus Woesebacteria bacterium RBG_16_41_13]
MYQWQKTRPHLSQLQNIYLKEGFYGLRSQDEPTPTTESNPLNEVFAALERASVKVDLIRKSGEKEVEKLQSGTATVTENGQDVPYAAILLSSHQLAVLKQMLTLGEQFNLSLTDSGGNRVTRSLKPEQIGLPAEPYNTGEPFSDFISGLTEPENIKD